MSIKINTSKVSQNTKLITTGIIIGLAIPVIATRHIYKQIKNNQISDK